MFVSDLDDFKKQFLFDTKAITEKEEIPGDLIMNWDHTGYIMSQYQVGLWQKKG